MKGSYFMLEDVTFVTSDTGKTEENNVQATVAASAPAASETQQAQPGTFGTVGMIIYLLVIVGAFYFLVIAPQRKRNKQLTELQDSIKPGDEVMTSSGFYGTAVDVNDERVIVEFGSSGAKSVRIPVKKSEIYGSSGVNVEKDK